MNDVISILGRRLDVTEPQPPPPDEPGHGEHDSDGSGREPPDDCGVLVAV